MSKTKAAKPARRAKPPAKPASKAQAPSSPEPKVPRQASVFGGQRAAYEALKTVLAEAQASGSQTVQVQAVLDAAAGHWPEVEAYRLPMGPQGAMTLGVLADLIGSLPIPPKAPQ